MNVLALILARGGSKSIPKKSIAPLAGKPLLSYVIRAARESKTVNRIILSTDHAEIADVGKECGAEVPFLRPKELAQDTTPDLPVFRHALQWLAREEGYVPDIIVHIRPTAPFMCGKDIDRAVNLLKKNPAADSVRSVLVPEKTPFKMWIVDEKTNYLKPLLANVFPNVFRKLKEPFNMPRQLLPVVWRYAGYVDVVRRDTIMKQRSMSGARQLPLFFEEWRCVDIDSPRDLRHAEEIFKERIHEI